MFLIKTKSGSYLPAYNSDKELSDKIKPGEEVYASKRRNPDFHRKAMALMRLGFENQDKVDEFEIYRQILTMRAGFVFWITGTDGKEHPLPKSISFDKMNAEEFDKFYSAIKKVISVEAKISGNDLDQEIQNYY